MSKYSHEPFAHGYFLYPKFDFWRTDMHTTVQKYGGSSVETIEKMRLIADKIIREKEKQTRLVVVTSAMGKTTNQLIDIARQASSMPSKRELDLLMSTGEQVSIALLTMILNEKRISSCCTYGFTSWHQNRRSSHQKYHSRHRYQQSRNTSKSG